MATEPRLPVPASPIDINNLVGTNPFGTGTTRTDITSGVNPQADALIQSILASVTPENMQNLIQGILLKSKTAFGPNIAQSIAAGNRTPSDSSLALLQSDAQARATAEAAQAVLEAQTAAQRTAANIVDTKLQANRQQTSKTSATPGGKFLAYLGGANLIKNLLPSGIAKNFWNPATSSDAVPELLGGPGFEGAGAPMIDTLPEQLSGPGMDLSAASDVLPSAGSEGLDLAGLGLDTGAESAIPEIGATGVGIGAAGAGAVAFDQSMLGTTQATEEELLTGTSGLPGIGGMFGIGDRGDFASVTSPLMGT